MNSINENAEQGAGERGGPEEGAGRGGRCGPGGRFGRHGSKKKKALKLILLPIFFIAMVAAKSAVVMLLWNYLIPDLFHGPEVNYLQAIAITVLAKLLTGFGGKGRGGFGRGIGGPGRGFGGGGRGWWDDMSREEKEKMRDEMRERFANRGGGRGGHRSDGDKQ